MTRPIAFDPAATARILGVDALAEVYLRRQDDGALLLVGETDGGVEFSVLLRSDFLDAVIAQARASEQSAA